MNATNQPLTIHRCIDHRALGVAAAAMAARTLREVLGARARARVLLAAAPSQEATLGALAVEDLPFSRIDFFHMDEYVGLPSGAPQGFANWLDRHFFRLLRTDACFFRINSTDESRDRALAYAKCIGPQDFDVTLCGLGVNAHLAFNDPPADFNDPAPVREVALTSASRHQQVDEGHFATIDAVPLHAITVTIPRLLATGLVVCSVPGRAKRNAVAATVSHGPDPDVPGTALKLHPAAHLFVDADSYPVEARNA